MGDCLPCFLLSFDMNEPECEKTIKIDLGSTTLFERERERERTLLF